MNRRKKPKHAQAAIAEVDAALEIQKAQIEAARQAALEEAGFTEASTAENIQKQIDAAKESGDEVLQYQLERRQEEMRINEEFDAQAKAAEEKAAREKAEIQYKADKAAYAMDIINAVNAIAMGVMNSLSAGFPVGAILAALTAAAGSVQLGLLLANPPKPPHFADGGFVPGLKAQGDNVPIMASAGELILNQAQQENVADSMTGGKEIVLNAAFILDSEVVGRGVFRWANNEGAVLQARAVMQ
ncbi:MAG: hypothetical protein Ta2A_07670 [Treponemataceae bacterium]|nr:MAG: hypothetical protein Ta2A_07670 [Treponemataceae bacterium]